MTTKTRTRNTKPPWYYTSCVICERQFHHKIDYTPEGTLNNPDPEIRAKYEEEFQMLEVVCGKNKETKELEYNHVGVCRRCFVNYRNRPREERPSSFLKTIMWREKVWVIA